MSSRHHFELMLERNGEHRKEFPHKLRVMSLSTSTNMLERFYTEIQTKTKNKQGDRQFQSYHDSFRQAFEREKIYLFYNKGQAIQLLEANFEGIAKQLQMYI